MRTGRGGGCPEPKFPFLPRSGSQRHREGRKAVFESTSWKKVLLKAGKKMPGKKREKDKSIFG